MALVVAALILVLIVGSLVKHKEAFASGGAECPTEAIRGPDGMINVKPGNRKFKTLAEYVGYLSDIYAKGSTCIPPKVTPARREPIAGVFGGVGNGAESPSDIARQGTTREVLNTAGPEMTSAKTPINKLDDYEYTRVFQSENPDRNALSSETKNHLMQKNILDWAKLPFNSETRATAEDEFVAGRMESGFRDPKTGVFFDTMDGKTLEPPDVEDARLREHKIMAAYRPSDIGSHVIDSETEAVAKLVHKVYENDKKWEPVVVKTGENQFQITELRPKASKERYADDTTVSLAMAEANGSYNPRPAIDIADRMKTDPYFDNAGVADHDNNSFWNYKDFNKWTPGLERMFAPTLDKREWH